MRENCPAKKATCAECKEKGHLTNTPACRVKRVSGIKVEAVNSAKSTNVVEIIANGPYKDVPIQLKADTGAIITVMNAKSLEELDWVEIEDTNMHIQGYNGKAEPCFGKASINFKRGNRCSPHIVYFSHEAVSNLLSKDAFMALGFVPSYFSYAEVNVVMET